MMKIAVLSDIHGNYAALQECVKYALNREIEPEEYWNLAISKLLDKLWCKIVSALFCQLQSNPELQA